MPPGHAFRIVEINENVYDVEDLPDGFPVDLELRGPDGRGEAAEDALLDVLEALPASPPRARSAFRSRGRRRRRRVA